MSERNPTLPLGNMLPIDCNSLVFAQCPPPPAGYGPMSSIRLLLSNAFHLLVQGQMKKIQTCKQFFM